MTNARADRLADRIKQIVANVVTNKMEDPRLGFVTITDVNVSSDLSAAKIYYTVMGNEGKTQEDTAKALESAKGMIRTELAKELDIRQAPTVEFIADDVPEKAGHIEDVIAQTRKKDEEIAEQASSSTPAGDENPYKHQDADDNQ